MGQPLFSPSSVFWRVNRELASGLAGPRAVLMQIAHPLVAAGVAEHSRFRQHRLARLYRTSMAAAAITFGSREFALRAIRSVNEKHRQVHGVLKAPEGALDRKSTRLNSSHDQISYAVFCLKKKKHQPD